MSALAAAPSASMPVGKALLAIDNVTDEAGAASAATAAATLVNNADINTLFEVRKEDLWQDL